MDIKIERKDAFKVAGVMVDEVKNDEFSEIWEKLFKNTSVKSLEKLGNGKSYGVCYESNNVDLINYMAAYDVKDQEKAKELGLDILEIPAAEYAIVKLKGSVPDCIQAGWKYIDEVFFLEQGYKHAGTLDLEAYSEGDMSSEEYKMELWVPIIKAP